MSLDRIPIEVPKHDSRRERVIGSVLAKVAAMRTAERADAVMAEPRSRMRFAIAFAATFAAAAVLVWVLVRTPATPSAPPSAPSLVVTPIGGSSRFTVGDSMIEAGPDTSVEVLTAADGAVTLALARGSVECDVAPRASRPPFRVVAGDVTVEVVGTRFMVARRPAVRVDVARGKVKVIAPTGTAYVLPGESWPQAAPPPPAPIAPLPTAPIETPPAPPPPAPTQASPQSMFKDAQRLRQRNPAKSERLYRTLANNSDVWAALSLYDLAEMHGSDAADRALHELDELERRFPRAANLEDAAWLRIEILRKAGRTDDARHAAVTYLRRFPSGTYSDQAARVAAP